MRNLKVYKRKNIIGILFIMALSNALVGCTLIQLQPADPTMAPWEHEIDPTFRLFYNHYGGIEVFGPAISDARKEGDVLVQYTEAAKMIYAESASTSQRFYLASLGTSLIIPEPEVSKPQNSPVIYVAGHVIHPVFAETYGKLEDILGKPLTEARKNVEYHRVEQLFENLGLTYDLTSGKVGFLAYGLAMCDSRCRKTEPEYSIPLQVYPVDPTFQEMVNTLGVDFTGYPITPAYMTAEGRWQQIFENVVYSTESLNQPGTIMLEPIAQTMPFIKDAPKKYNADPAVIFAKTHGEKGYEIPLFFWEYLQAHGGLDVSGIPISQPRQLSATSYVQCFTNLCLENDLEAIETRRVHLVGLGYPYKTMHGPVEPGYLLSTNTPTTAPETPTITLKVWDALRTLDTRLQQEVGVYVTMNQEPLEGIEPTLWLTLPNGVQVEYVFPPTGKDGQSVLRLPLIEGNNGDVTFYAVCVLGGENFRFCVEENFLIWNNP